MTFYQEPYGAGPAYVAETIGMVGRRQHAGHLRLIRVQKHKGDLQFLGLQFNTLILQAAPVRSVFAQPLGV